MPAFPWWQRRAWVHGSDCHNLCMLIVALRRQHLQAQHILAKLVAQFLKPPQVIVAAGCDNNVLFINAVSGDLLRNVNLGHDVHSLACAPSGENVAVRCKNEQVFVIDAESGNVLYDIQLGERPQGPVVYSPSGEHIAMIQRTFGNYERQLYIVESSSGNVLHDVFMNIGLVNLVYAPNGETIAALHKNGFLCLVKVESGTKLHELYLGTFGTALNRNLGYDDNGDDEDIPHHSMSLVYAPSSRDIFVGLGGGPCLAIRIVNVESGAIVRDVVARVPAPYATNPSARVAYPSFAPNAKSVAICTDRIGTSVGNEIHIFDIAPHAMILEAPTSRDGFGDISYLEFAPDSKSLAAVYLHGDQTHLCTVKLDSGEVMWSKAFPLSTTLVEYGNIVLRYLHCGDDAPSAERPEDSVEGRCVSQQSVQVTEAVTHMDPPARIDVQEAMEFAAVQHAGFVERNLESAAGAQPDNSQEKIWMCKINRNTKQLRTALREGPSLRPCREALEADGHPWMHSSGALVFVHPSEFRRVTVELDTLDLRPDNIIFAETFEYLVQETLDRCKCICKAGRHIIHAEDSINEPGAGSSEEAELDEDGVENREQVDTPGGAIHFNLQALRTFICAIPIMSDERHVTASTTDADSARGINPRRMVLRATFDDSNSAEF